VGGSNPGETGKEEGLKKIESTERYLGPQPRTRELRTELKKGRECLETDKAEVSTFSEKRAGLTKTEPATKGKKNHKRPTGGMVSSTKKRVKKDIIMGRGANEDSHYVKILTLL